MTTKKTRTLLLAGGIATAVTLSAGTALAGDGDLNCGDEGTYTNMTMTVFDPDHQPGDPGYDPNGLDADGNGIGCEDPGEPMPGDPGHPETVAAQPDTTETPAAAPVEGQPSFAG